MDVEVISSTSEFHIIPETVEEFQEWLSSLEEMDNYKLEKVGEDWICRIYRMGHFRYYPDEEKDPEDALPVLAERFLKPGHGVLLEGVSICGNSASGWAQSAVKNLSGEVTLRGISTYGFLEEEVEEWTKTGITLKICD